MAKMQPPSVPEAPPPALRDEDRPALFRRTWANELLADGIKDRQR